MSKFLYSLMHLDATLGAASKLQARLWASGSAEQIALLCSYAWVHVCACGECRRVGGTMLDKLSRDLHTPWSVVLSGNVGVGPLVRCGIGC